MEGWVKVHRNLMEHPIWMEKPFSKGQAWVDIILSANHAGRKVLIGNKMEAVDSGSFITSELKLMARWGWSKNKVRAFLKLLENDNMIVKNSNSKRTAITIVNYSKYQVLETTKEPQKDCKETADGLQKVHEQELKNDKNVKNKTYTCAFETLWSAYPRKKEKAKAYGCFKARLSDGFSEDELILAVKRYADECKGREDRFIKLCATFLGPNTPFMDYLGKGEENDTGRQTETDPGGLVEQAIRAGVSTEFEGF